ncbi:MAG: hypothetical protein AB7U95_14185, partial [Reyranella sp.]
WRAPSAFSSKRVRRVCQPFLIRRRQAIDGPVDETHTADLKLAGLRIWVHGWQFPDTMDYRDGNWLRVTVRCGGDGGSVVVRGPILHLSELTRWTGEAEKLLEALAGEARLSCLEPNLSVLLKAASRGQIMMEVSITPDHLTQKHWFQFEIDQSYLPALIVQCRAILETYPLRGERTA